MELKKIEKRYRLRWAFEYVNRKPIYGVWDNASPHLTDMAWNKDKTGLKYALVEGEEIGRWGIYRLLECTADRFVTLKWISMVSMPCGMSHLTSAGDIVGLQLLTPENSFSVFIDGKIIKKSLSDHDKKFDLKEFQTKVI